MCLFAHRNFIVNLLLDRMNLRGPRKPKKTNEGEALKWCGLRDPPWIVEGDAGVMGECQCWR